MQRFFSLALGTALMLGTAVEAVGEPPPPDVLAGIVDDEPNPLPKYATREEQLLPLPEPAGGGSGRSSAPSGAVYCPAEYEPCEGALVRWGSYNALLTEFIVGLTTQDPQAVAYVVVANASQQSSATTTLAGAGADLSQVTFIVQYTNTVWIRDYGPRFIFEDGLRAIIDHTYNRPRPSDNALPDYLSLLWGEPQYDIPLTHGGGNFHLFSNGDAFMSDLVLDENPGLTEQDVKDLFSAYENLNLTVYPGFPTNIDSTRHIDMWMVPVADAKIIIGQYSGSPGYPAQQITDNAVADLTARGYTVYRTPGWNSGTGGINGTHYTYTNAVVLNNLVFVPGFGGSYAGLDAQAVSVFQAAMPGHTVLQVDCSSIIHAAGAIHCIVMHVPAYAEDPIPVVRVYAPDGGEVWAVGQQQDIIWAAHDDVAVTGVDIYYSTDGGVTYPYVIASGEPDDGAFAWTVPNTASSQCRVKVVAHDADLNSGEDASDGDFMITDQQPQVVYSFAMNTDPGWGTEGLWAWGQPNGGGGEYGGPDPTSGYTGPNVYGYNLSGDYENNLPERHLTSTALDCTGLYGVTLSFRRWLGVEQPVYDHAYVRASNNGTDWVTIWQNTGTLTDASWVYQAVDISSVADNQPSVQMRWTMGTTDVGWRYCGWNIDDVELSAIVAPIAGDCNCDGVLDINDVAAFALALTDPAAYASQYPGCDPYRADMDGSGILSGSDIVFFVNALLQP